MSVTEMKNRIKAVEAIIGHNFHDPSLLWEALQGAGSGVYQAGTREVPDGNKRLALIGDATQKLILVTDGYSLGKSKGSCKPSLSICSILTHCSRMLGKISEVVSSNLSNDALKRACTVNGLERYIRNNPAQGNIISAGLKATTVEAILGAVYLDSNRDTNTVKDVMSTLGLVWSE